MAWRTVAAVIIITFAAVLLWSVTAKPLNMFEEDMTDLDDTQGDELDAQAQFPGLSNTYFTGFWLLILGIIAWGFWRVFREEITQRGGGL